GVGGGEGGGGGGRGLPAARGTPTRALVPAVPILLPRAPRPRGPPGRRAAPASALAPSASPAPVARCANRSRTGASDRAPRQAAARRARWRNREAVPPVRAPSRH